MKYNFIRFPEGKGKAVTLSYDDGPASDERMLEIINKYNIKCTFNLVGNAIDKEINLTKDFIREHIIKKGHEVANHGYVHRSLNNTRPIEGIQEVLNSRLSLEKAFGIIIRGMAFPDKKVDRFLYPDLYKRIKSCLEQLDIVYCRSLGADNDRFELPEDWHCWIPTAHHNNPKLNEYIDKFVNFDFSKQYIARRDAQLFYLWGHSFEFDRDNNWELLEEVCKKFSDYEDIWFATNIEIYNYVEAYKSLIYSGDGNIIYNPTLIDIWFDIDGELYKIKSGETIKIV